MSVEWVENATTISGADWRLWRWAFGASRTFDLTQREHSTDCHKMRRKRRLRCQLDSGWWAHVSLALVLLVLLARQVSGQSTKMGQPDKAPASSQSQFGAQQQVSTNMSAHMQQQQQLYQLAALMTNSSLANRTASPSSKQNVSINSSGGGINNLAATRGKNSPAFNSRQQVKQQQQQFTNSTTAHEQVKPKAAAFDMATEAHETQALTMPAQSATATYSSSSSSTMQASVQQVQPQPQALPSAPQSTAMSPMLDVNSQEQRSHQQQSSLEQSDNKVRHELTSAQNSISARANVEHQSTISGPQAALKSRAGQGSAQLSSSSAARLNSMSANGWQTVASSSATVGGASFSSGRDSQRARLSGGAMQAPKNIGQQAQLALPPQPVGYISRPWQQVEAGEQLDKPSGYSYDSSASYTHTARPETSARRSQQQLGLESSVQRATSSLAYAQHQHQQQQQQLDISRVRPEPVRPAAQAPNPCKASYPNQALSLGSLFAQQQQQLELQADSSAHSAVTGARYVRVGEGTRLRSQLIFKVLRADSLTDCELACSRAAGDLCRSFNYRAYFAAENCELSRLGLGALKLDDAGQFEQHTQFDFYALLDLGLGASLAQLQQQQLDAASECLDVAQSCSLDGMEFTLRTSEPFTGRIYTYGFYDSCFVRGDASSLTSVLRISRANGFPRCGTQQLGDLMTNIVVVQFSEHVQTTRDKKYNLTCYLSGPAEAVVTSNYLDTKLDERSQPMQIEQLPPQNVLTSSVRLRVLYRGQPTNTIAVGDLLTFRLEASPAQAAPSKVNSIGLQQQQHQARQLLGGGGGGGGGGAGSEPAQHQNEIFATNVIAKDPYSGRQVQLIDARGCPVDALNVFPELQRTPEGALESEFYAFKIPDSSFLIFQATVRTCKAPCEPVICQSAAGRAPPAQSAAIKSGASLGAYLMAPHASSAPSWGRRRRRRQVSFEDSEELVSERERELISDEPASQLQDLLPVGANESVEHIIPVRLQPARLSPTDTEQKSSARSRSLPRVVTRRARPELSEPEEEVKEMFRVYMSRAELDRQRHKQSSAGEASIAAMASAHLAAGPEHQHQQQLEAERLNQAVCLTPATYYVMLFALISLSLLVCSVLAIVSCVARQGKLCLNDPLADAMF